MDGLFGSRRRFLAVVAGLLALTGLVAWLRWDDLARPRRLARLADAVAARDWPAAEALVEPALRGEPGDGTVRALAARVARNLGRPEEARGHLRAAERAADGSLDPRVALERQLLAAESGGYLTVAESLRERAEGGDPEAEWILEALIDGAVQHGLPLTAFGLVNRYLELRPADARGWLGRGRICRQLFYFEDAAKSFRRARELDPALPEAREELAEALLVAGDPAEAAAEFAALVRERPDAPALRLGLARAELKRGRLPEAARLLDERLAAVPDDAAFLAERGALALQAGDAAAAERMLVRATAARPFDRTARYALWQAQLALKRPEAAASADALKAIDADLARVKEITTQLSARPDRLDLQAEAGALFLRTGEPDEGVRRLNLVLRYDPTHRAAREALARWQAGRW